jgi:hypothetical protein
MAVAGFQLVWVLAGFVVVTVGYGVARRVLRFSEREHDQCSTYTNSFFEV